MTRAKAFVTGALMLLSLAAFFAGCGGTVDQPADTGQDDKSRNELTR